MTDLFDAEERNWLFPLFFSFHRRVEGIVTGFGRRRSVRAVTEREAFQRSGWLTIQCFGSLFVCVCVYRPQRCRFSGLYAYFLRQVFVTRSLSAGWQLVEAHNSNTNASSNVLFWKFVHQSRAPLFDWVGHRSAIYGRSFPRNKTKQVDGLGRINRCSYFSRSSDGSFHHFRTAGHWCVREATLLSAPSIGRTLGCRPGRWDVRSVNHPVYSYRWKKSIASQFSRSAYKNFVNHRQNNFFFLREMSVDGVGDGTLDLTG